MNKIIKIEGMSCGHCENRVKNALSAIEGVTVIRVSASENLAEIELADECLMPAVEVAIDDAGYDIVK